jgi:hypothetical protein
MKHSPFDRQRKPTFPPLTSETPGPTFLPQAHNDFTKCGHPKTDISRFEEIEIKWGGNIGKEQKYVGCRSVH